MRYGLDQEVDACVIGSGASGSVVAKELGEAGWKVVVLEAGGPTDPAKIPTALNDWEDHTRDFFASDADPKRDAVTLAPESSGYRLSRFKGVGGSTMHYEGFYIRMHPEDWKRHTRYGVAGDWPINYEELTPLYDRVESFIGVSGALDNPFEPRRKPYPMPAVPMSCAVQAMARAAKRTGLHPAHAPLAILTEPRGARGSCNYCGGCWMGCHMGAISNAALTYIPAALRNGVELRAGCMVSKIALGKDRGRAQAVEYLDARGRLHRQRARTVVLCGNAVETARLLLLSAQPGCAEGLANSSGLVGRGFMGHARVTAKALLPQRVNAYMGPNINGMIQDFYGSDDKRGFIGGYVVALRNAQLGPVRFHRQWIRDPALFGTDLYRRMDEKFGRSVEMHVYGEQLPHPDNSVTLDAEVKDSFGLPVPHIRNTLFENERKLQDHAEKTLKAILDAAGATESSVERDAAALGTHVMGTARMGNDPETSVTNPVGRTHDVKNLFIADGSLFPTSTPANPTLTIQALATRVAFGMIGRSR